LRGNFFLCEVVLSGMKYCVAYIGVALVFLSVDALWLGVIITDFMQSHLSHLLADQTNLMIAALFYLFYAGGIVLFAVKPALEAKSLKIALIYGGVFGLLCYGTYDLTNLATLKDWPVQVVVVDMAWGTFLTALSAGAGFTAVQKFSTTR